MFSFHNIHIHNLEEVKYLIRFKTKNELSLRICTICTLFSMNLPKYNQTLQLTTHSPDCSHLTLSELIVCYVHCVLVDSNQVYFPISINSIQWKEHCCNHYATEHVCHDRSNHCDISLKYFKLTLLLFSILYYNCQIWAIEHAIFIFLPHKIDFEGRYAINRNFLKAKSRKTL